MLNTVSLNPQMYAARPSNNSAGNAYEDESVALTRHQTNSVASKWRRKWYEWQK